MSVILTSELEAEVTAIYQEIRAAQAPAPLERETINEQVSGPRMLSVVFSLAAVVLLVGVPTWVLGTVLRRNWGLW